MCTTTSKKSVRAKSRHTTKPRASSHRRSPSVRNREFTRQLIGLAFTTLVAITVILSVWMPTALTVLDKLLPTLGLLFGYYFGRLQT